MIPEWDLRAAAASIAAGAQITDAQQLSGGSSAAVVRLRLVTPGGLRRDVVVRQYCDRAGKGHSAIVAAKEYRVLRHLAGEGLAVPVPLALHGDITSGGPWLATEWVDGSTAIEHSNPDVNPDVVVDAMASFLVRLHSLDPAALDVPGLGRIEDPAEALHHHLPSDPVAQALGDALTKGITRAPNRDVLLHGDFWPGNVLVRQQKIAAVIDWEDATVGDPLVDLACARVELTCAFGIEAANRFADAYLHEIGSLDRNDLPLWEAYVAATALSSMHLWGLDPADEALRRMVTRACFERAAGSLLAR